MTDLDLDYYDETVTCDVCAPCGCAVTDTHDGSRAVEHDAGCPIAKENR